MQVTSKPTEMVLAVVLVAVAMVFLAPPIITLWRLPNCGTTYCGSDVVPVIGMLLLFLLAVAVCLYLVFLAAFDKLRRIRQ